MDVPKYAQVAFAVVMIITVVLFVKNSFHSDDLSPVLQTSSTTDQNFSTEDTSVSSFTLPIQNIVQSENVAHSVPISEIRRGCARQDCIPSVDSPEFTDAQSLFGSIDSESIGIALSYKGEERFYPFPMLETHELVNDVVAGDPLLISYCPLCGTGIVFERTVDGMVYEFGVSGMLWQSNLLMYNRSENIADRSLWSQVLGKAVVGSKTGTKLTVVSSDIMRFGDWSALNPSGSVLTTGAPRDPYGGEYYAIAQRFAPDFDPETSPFTPDTYVYGVEVGGTFKAYPRDLLSEGVIHDMINGEEITITHSDDKVVFATGEDEVIQDVEGFWFSWFAAHPETEIWDNNN